MASTQAAYYRKLNSPKLTQMSKMNAHGHWLKVEKLTVKEGDNYDDTLFFRIHGFLQTPTTKTITVGPDNTVLTQ